MATTARQLCKQLEITRRTLTRWVKQGCPHGKSDGKSLSFDKGQVLAWMATVGRTGDTGRPAEGTTQETPRPAGAKAKPLTKAQREAAALSNLTKRVNLRVKELEVQRRERLERTADGELAPVSEFTSFMQQQIAMVQARFQAFPGQVIPKLLEQDYDTMYAVLEEELQAIQVAFAQEYRT